jgi:AcrR family transcriptional regulator
MATPRRRLRTDAARNVERIIDAAHRVFARSGPDGAIEDVAVEAGVGVATVYRRFPTKELLLRAVLDRRFEEFLGSTARATEETHPLVGMRMALAGAVGFLTDDPNTIAAATSSGLLTMDMAYRFFGPVSEILHRGQQAGVFRDDLATEDVPRIVLMLIGTLPTIHPGSDGWQRYLDLILDLLTASRAELSALSPVRDHKPPPLLDLPRPGQRK